jgi:1-acyl-sn-glycerol-3-phosphate acyltransferase
MIGRALGAAVRFATGTTDRWVDCEPSTRQRVYFGNHSSHLDIVILWASLPRDVRQLVRPVAARDYWESTRLRRYLVHRVFNAIMIDRAGHGGGFSDAAHALDAAVDGMGDRHSLIIFPEGTRGTGATVAPFKSGIYHIAHRKPGLECVPVYMENLNRILPKGEFLPAPLIGSISFGRPLVLGADESRTAFLDRARQALVDLARM